MKHSFSNEKGKEINALSERVALNYNLVELKERIGLGVDDRFSTEHWMALHESLVCAKSHNIKLEYPLDIDDKGLMLLYLTRIQCLFYHFASLINHVKKINR